MSDGREIQLESRPDLHDSIREAAHAIVDMLHRRGSFSVHFEPGDMTRYSLFGCFGIGGKELCVAYATHGAYGFPLAGAPYHGPYVGTKLGSDNQHAWKVLADLVNLVIAFIVEDREGPPDRIPIPGGGHITVRRSASPRVRAELQRASTELAEHVREWDKEQQGNGGQP